MQPSERLALALYLPVMNGGVSRDFWWADIWDDKNASSPRTACASSYQSDSGKMIAARPWQSGSSWEA